jgi:hypothetical protein
MVSMIDIRVALVLDFDNCVVQARLIRPIAVVDRAAVADQATVMSVP